MSLFSPIIPSDTNGVKFAKLQRLFRTIADNLGISYVISALNSDIKPADTEGVKFAKLGKWAETIANNPSPGGSGDVVGPASSTDGRIALFDGVTGKLLKESATPNGSGLTNLNPSNLVTGSGAVTISTAVNTDLSLSPSGTGKLNLPASMVGSTELSGVLTATGLIGGIYVVSPLYAFAAGGSTGISENAAGVAEINNATPGAFRDLKLRDLIAAGTLTVGSTSPVTGIRTAVATLDFGSILAAGYEDKTITVTGAAVGMAVIIGLPATVVAGIIFNAWVSAADTVTIRANNAGSIAADPASASYRATVISF